MGLAGGYHITILGLLTIERKRVVMVLMKTINSHS